MLTTIVRPFRHRAYAAIWLLILSIPGILTAQAQAQTRDSAIAFDRARHLTRGINLAEWFAQVYDPRGYTKEHFQSWNTAEDIALIRSMGFDHVRLSINPQPMMRHNQTR